MQVYKLTLAYTYYAMQIGAAEYMIIGYTQLTGLQNGFALGSLIDEVEPQEVEPCDAQLADFDFCQTHLFETFLKLEEGKEKVRLNTEEANNTAHNLIHMLRLCETMRSNQNRRGVATGLYENQLDAKLTTIRRLMPAFFTLD